MTSKTILSSTSPRYVLVQSDATTHSLTHLNHQRIMDDETETRPESVRECFSSQIYKAIKVRDEREILALKLQIN